MKQTKTLASGFPVLLDDERAKYVAREVKYEETIESLRQQLSDTQREAAHWKNNHETEVRRARILKERTDMPIERVQAYERWCLDLAENAALRQQLASITEERDQWKNDAINGGNAAYLRQQLKHMTYQYNAALEAEQVRYRQVVEKDAEIARLNSKLHSQALDCIAADGQAFDSWQQLAASQAREQHVMCVVEQVALALDAYFSYERGLDQYIEELNGLYKESQDTAAIEAMIAKAGEVMRERCAVECETHYNFSNALAAAIRALPGVTLEDIK